MISEADGTRGPGAVRDIAVIGMAARLPEADDLQQFLRNLQEGRDSVRELSADRIHRTSLDPNPQHAYQLVGFLDDIDTFDNEFFGIAKGEAQHMAPEHRLLLQVAYQAVENAGYAPGALEGVRGSVYVADTRIEYGELVLNPGPFTRMGTHLSAMAGRLSRFFGLRGPATMVDAACASALYAVHLAGNDLLLGDADVAMVCGTSIHVLADHKTGELDIGIRSADGKARAFSADAAGTGSGEGVAVVLLKRLDAALRDGDTVHAVIKATAANNDSSRASTLTAPDSAAQAEVIQLAWEKAGIDPLSVSFIEGHGTGTPLGDPIEIEGIDLAFRRFTDRKNFVALSTVKSNIGHTWSMAGLVGLIKAILSLRARQLFPTLHAAALNPLIDFANSAVAVTQQLTPWEPETGIRRAGVSSFGVIGTNVHAIVEEAPSSTDARLAANLSDSVISYLVPLSGKSPSALAANAAALCRWIEERPGLSLADIERTLTAGRDHHPFRLAVTSSSSAELIASLSQPVQADTTGPVTTVLLLSDVCNVGAELLAELQQRFPVFDGLYADALNTASRVGVSDAQFAFQYAFVGTLDRLGVHFDHIVAQSAGKCALDAVKGRISLAEALQGAAAEDRVPPSDLEARVDRLIDKFTSGNQVLFVEAGPLSTISEPLSARAGEDYDVLGLDRRGVAGFLAGLYAAGIDWRWDVPIGSGGRIELPSYQFDRTRCWLDEADLRTRPAEVGRTTRGAALVDPLTAVSEAWLSVLGVTPDADASFFDLGGDSIGGMQIIHRLSETFAIDLDEYAIFDHETPQKLAAHLREVMAGAGSEQIPGQDSLSRKSFSASPGQLNIWVASQFEEGSAAFNLTRTFRVDGQVDTDALRESLNGLAVRHMGLRATFGFADGELTQTIADAEGYTVPLQVARSLEARPEDPALTDLIRPFAAAPFDLESGPLIRAQLVSFSSDQHVLTLSTHHSVVDGWSLNLLVRDLFALYRSFAYGRELELPAVEVDYRDYHLEARRLDDESLRAASAYWLDQYADLPVRIDLPARSAVGPGAFKGTYRDYLLPAALAERLKQFAKAEGGTVFASAVSAFAAVLARRTDQGEFVIGTSLSGRGRPGTDQLVAMMVQTLPLRLQIDDSSDFRALFAHVRSQFAAGVQHSDYPYEELVQTLQQRGITQSPHLFDVLIEFERFAGTEESITALSGDAADLAVTPVDVTLETSVFPLNIMLGEQPDSLGAVIRYDRRFFDVDAIDELWESFVALLDTVLLSPQVPLSEVPRVTAGEQRRLLALGAHDFDFDAGAKIHLAIERFARTNPDQVCLQSSNGERTYAQLNARANRLARYFRTELGVEREEVVALVMDRSVLMVEAILALWKCGAAYLPVDAAYPPAYVRTMLQSSQVRLVAVDPTRMTSELCAQLAGGWTPVEVTAVTGAEQDDDDLDITTGDSALAYVIYTSGSTGVPKGVMVEHLGMLNHLHAKIRDLAIDHSSVIAQTASNSFDISVWQMFAALYAGGRTVIYEPSVQLDPARLGERIDTDGVTVLEVVPSYLDAMLDAWVREGRHLGANTLTHLLVTGEAVLPRSVNDWLARYPRIPVVNAYGPTEASDDVTHHVMTEPVTSDSVPLGSPIHNTRIYVLDDHLRVSPAGMRGEIYVSGIGVGRGYLHDPEQTARVFGRDPFDPGRRMYRTGDIGYWNSQETLEYVGRADSQIKIRGFRVDLNEIERRVDACPGVRAAAVVRPSDAMDQLTAYVVLEPSATLAECRTVLTGQLPQHMVPTHFVDIPSLPLTSNGKIDRGALTRMDLPASDDAEVVKPTTPSEQALYEIWKQVLDRTEISIHDDFFEVGGNSLRAVQVLSRIRSQLNIPLELELVFSLPTISALAGALGQMIDTASEEDTIVSLGGPGTYPLAHTQELMLGMEATYDRADAFNRNDLYEVHGEVDTAALRASFAGLLARHEVLRTTFATEGGRPVQTVHPAGALTLPFRSHDFRGKPASDLTDFVERRIQTAFAITDEPPIRVDLLRTDGGWRMLTSMHQLVSDARTVDVLTDEWLELYDAAIECRAPNLQPLLFQYKDAARWRNDQMTGRRLREHRAFWLQELEGASSRVPLATDRPRPARTSFAGGRLRRRVPKLAERFKRLAGDHGITEFVIAQTAVSLLVLAETGGDDVTIGTYTRGRNRLDLENQLGTYINTVPMRLRWHSADSVADVLYAARRVALRALQHEAYPYGWTMSELGWTRGYSRTPLFDVMVAIDVAEAPVSATTNTHWLELRRFDLPRRAKEADLQFVFDRLPDGEMEISVTYSSELFDEARVKGMSQQLEAIVEGLAENVSPIEILERASNHHLSVLRKAQR